jgi:hypothetical protein
MIRLPSQRDLRRYLNDRGLDATEPRTQHYLFDEAWARGERQA